MSNPAPHDPAVIRVDVRLFAIFRRQAGTDRLALTLPRGATVADAVAALRDGSLPSLPRRPTFAVAVNQVYADDDVVLVDGAELALVPPVSGGSEHGHA